MTKIYAFKNLPSSSNHIDQNMKMTPEPYSHQFIKYYQMRCLLMQQNFHLGNDLLVKLLSTPKDKNIC